MVKMMIGARSILFFPFCNLGLSVVDEEDTTYKQEGGLLHRNARGMAELHGVEVSTLLADHTEVVLLQATPPTEKIFSLRLFFLEVLGLYKEPGMPSV